MLAGVLIAVGSIPVLWISRRSLLRPLSFGFYRFFAVESILALIVLNAPEWFAHPLAARQLVSWLLLLTSVVTVISGSLTLRRLGQPVSQGSADIMTTNLVTTGPYRHIRHPLYASLLFLGWGTLLKAVTPSTLILVSVATVALIATAKAEEVATIRQFGQA
ncbi:MAG: isoprenylcysteine carboxylmethyltransferase family protein [Acidobacteriia bacterium]|nr:isoprenylcysteine carboxylmethyltransferase family protein [Terriglobia bacterium]